MISTRDIKRKIRTIRNIQQMCRAMKTVSLVKLQKAETRLTAARPYAARMADTLARLTGALRETDDRAAEHNTVVVITSDKGLCGGYNASVLRHVQRESADEDVVALGRKGDRFLRRIGRQVTDNLVPLGSEPAFSSVVPVADRITNRLQSGELTAVTSVHGHFLHGTRSEIVTETMYPLIEENAGEIIIEPNPKVVADIVLRRYVRSATYAAVLESSASEHGARVAAMSAASDNADEMIAQLTMDYNRARQSAITKELSEIVGSAEALK